MNQYMKGVLCTIIGGACWGISGHLRRISVYLSRDGHQGFDRYAPILCRDYFMYVSCMQGKKKATGVFAYSQSIDPLHRVWRMWTYVYTVCISDCYFKDKCRYRDCTASICLRLLYCWLCA